GGGGELRATGAGGRVGLGGPAEVEVASGACLSITVQVLSVQYTGNPPLFFAHNSKSHVDSSPGIPVVTEYPSVKSRFSASTSGGCSFGMNCTSRTSSRLEGYSLNSLKNECSPSQILVPSWSRMNLFTAASRVFCTAGSS